MTEPQEFEPNQNQINVSADEFLELQDTTPSKLAAAFNIINLSARSRRQMLAASAAVLTTTAATPYAYAEQVTDNNFHNTDIHQTIHSMYAVNLQTTPNTNVEVYAWPSPQSKTGLQELESKASIPTTQLSTTTTNQAGFASFNLTSALSQVPLADQDPSNHTTLLEFDSGNNNGSNVVFVESDKLQTPQTRTELQSIGVIGQASELNQPAAAQPDAPDWKTSSKPGPYCMDYSSTTHGVRPATWKLKHENYQVPTAMTNVFAKPNLPEELVTQNGSTGSVGVGVKVGGANWGIDAGYTIDWTKSKSWHEKFIDYAKEFNAEAVGYYARKCEYFNLKTKILHKWNEKADVPLHFNYADMKRQTKGVSPPLGEEYCTTPRHKDFELDEDSGKNITINGGLDFGPISSSVSTEFSSDTTLQFGPATNSKAELCGTHRIITDSPYLVVVNPQAGCPHQANSVIHFSKDSDKPNC